MPNGINNICGSVLTSLTTCYTLFYYVLVMLLIVSISSYNTFLLFDTPEQVGVLRQKTNQILSVSNALQAFRFDKVV